MKYKFKIIDLLLTILTFMAIDDLRNGHFLSCGLNFIIICCNIKIRINELKIDSTK